MYGMECSCQAVLLWQAFVSTMMDIRVNKGREVAWWIKINFRMNAFAMNFVICLFFQLRDWAFA
jgi:hypothetical protein